MKTTIDLPDDLLIKAKVFAAQKRKTLREIVITGLERELEAGTPALKGKEKPAIRWITVKGGPPQGIDPANRDSLSDILNRPT